MFNHTNTLGVLLAATIVSISCHDAPTSPSTRPATYLWRVPGSAGGGFPAADASTVYFLAASDSHVVHAFDRATGALRWTAATGVTQPANFPLAGCRIAGALVVCGDNALVGLRRSDGALMWTFSPSGPSPGVLPASVNSAGTRIFAPAGGTVYSVDATTGAAVWTASILAPASIDVRITLTDDDIVVAPFRVVAHRDSGGVAALDAVTGATRWVTRFPVNDPDSSSGGVDVALSEGLVFASAEDGRVMALDRGTGAIQWTAPGVGGFPFADFAGRRVGFDLRMLAVAGSTVYATSSSGWLSAYSAATGALLWRTGDIYLVSFFPLAADDSTVYVNSASGTVAALSSASRSIKWRTSSAPAFQNFLAPPGAVVFAAAVNGYYAILK